MGACDGCPMCYLAHTLWTRMTTCRTRSRALGKWVQSDLTWTLRQHLCLERLGLGPPRWAAELGLSVIDLILTKLPQGPAVMIGRPPPPAAPKSGHRSDRPCHPKVAAQTHCLRNLERVTTTVDVPKTLLKCQSLRDQPGFFTGARAIVKTCG